MSLEEIGDRLERVVNGSPADETEIAWVELRHCWGSNRRRHLLPPPHVERTVLVRVIDGGRLGAHRTGSGSIGELENAVRQALAHSRIAEPVPGLPHLPGEAEPESRPPGLHDTRLSELDEDEAAELVLNRAEGRETAVMDWLEGRVAVFSSRSVRRRAEVTAASLEVTAGRRAGAGWAASSARSLEGVGVPEVFARARARHARGPDTAEVPDGPVSVVLSPEATGELCRLLRDAAFSARAYENGTSFLREHMGAQVFDRRLNLRDDGNDPAGLPFPFDLEGTPKRAVDLIVEGTPRTPALDQHQAAVLGLQPTGHAIGGRDALADHLFLLPGDASLDDLLAAADGGLWISRLDRLECYDPRRVRIRARARGARLIRDGRLAAAVPDLVWEDSLLRALSSLLAIGDEPVRRRVTSPGLLGGISAPALAIGGVTELRPAGRSAAP